VADKFYTDLRDNTVLPLIKQFGVPMVLKSNREPTIDPDTGAILVAAAEVSTTFDGLIRFYSQDQIDGKDILANDIQVLCEMSAFNTAGIVPDTSMQVIAQGITYNIVRETPTQPGGVRVLTKLQIRR
jgi:hypothetical protein